MVESKTDEGSRFPPRGEDLARSRQLDFGERLSDRKRKEEKGARMGNFR
jgi:hypothetical protein